MLAASTRLLGAPLLWRSLVTAVCDVDFFCPFSHWYVLSLCTRMCEMQRSLQAGAFERLISHLSPSCDMFSLGLSLRCSMTRFACTVLQVFIYIIANQYLVRPLANSVNTHFLHRCFTGDNSKMMVRRQTKGIEPKSTTKPKVRKRFATCRSCLHS